MSVLRSQLASRLLLCSNVVHRQVVGGSVRWAGGVQASSIERPKDPEETPPSSQPPGTPPGDGDMIRKEDSSAAIIGHNPDYHAPIDHATS